MDSHRPDPEVILDRLKAEQKTRLTMFLGACPGVGKTFAMLQSAHERVEEGVDLVIGWADTHGRKETIALLDGLEYLPRDKVNYKGILIEEMDLEGILARKPALVVVDELAHTNAPGSRHKRRYQDVEELLDAGISVYTTLNIQHLESLNDAVSQITGITVRETVPDSFIERADLVQLVDIPVDVLIKRLNEGKVYMPQLAGEALRNFFRPGNLNALRELALRFVSQKVDRELVEYRQRHDIEGTWPAADRVLVCIGPSPFGIRVLRAARRLADTLNAEVIAAHIETPRFEARQEDRENLSANVKLAEELGAEIVSLPGKDVAEAVVELASERNATHIVLGHPRHHKLKEIATGSVVDRVLARSKGVSIHVIPGDGSLPQTGRKRIRLSSLVFRPSDVAVILVLLIFITVLGKITGKFFSTTDMAMLYLLPVLYAGARSGIVASVITSVLGVLAFDIFFVPPYYSLGVASLHYITTFVVFIAVGITTGLIAGRLKEQVAETNAAMTKTSVLYDLSKDLTAISDMSELARIVVVQVSKAIGSPAVVYVPGVDNELDLMAANDPAARIAFDKNERAVAVWAFEHSQEAGNGTETLPGASGIYLPLKTEVATIGVLGVELSEGDARRSFEKRELLERITDVVTLALNKLLFSLAEQHMKNLEDSEQLVRAVFDSISHELKTPLSSIVGSVSALEGNEHVFTEEQRAELLASISTGATRMNRLVNNLLDMARLESGSLRPREDSYDVQDLLGVATAEFSDELANRKLSINTEESLPPVHVDFDLTVRVFANLIDNAIKYSPDGSDIGIAALSQDDRISVSFSDEGPGIPDSDKELIFDKFYRLLNPGGVAGTGLGLSICKSILKAEGGSIRVEDRPGGGSSFVVTLSAAPAVAGLR
jgi:two-component system sensor histidine kinase KdpD